MPDRQRVDDEELVDQGTSAWSPAEVVAAVFGVAAVAVGTYVLIQTGINTEDLSRPTESVFGVEHTPLLALCEVGFGVLMLFAAMSVAFGRVVMGLLSAALAAFGAVLVSAAPTSRMHHHFGVEGHDGWYFVIIGAFALLTALAFPTIRRHTVLRTVPVSDPAPVEPAPVEPAGRQIRARHWWQRTSEERVADHEDDRVNVS